MTVRMRLLSSTMLIALVALLGCSGAEEARTSDAAGNAVAGGGGGTATAAADGHPAPAGQATPVTEGTFQGKVAETFDASDYTYVRLEGGGTTVWAAGPRTQVAVGEKLGIALTMPMHGFKSESLGRTFDTIYFVGNFDRDGAGDPHAGMGMGQDPHAGLEMGGDPHAGMAKGSDPHAGLDPALGTDPDAAARTAPPTTNLSLEGIEKAAGGHTVAEVWGQKASLAGKEVVVRGRVVKYNSAILGKNWLHLQDGSGSAAGGNHDLTVTSAQPAKVGDIVTVRGVLGVDRDFGAGYAYDLIVEDAKLDIAPTID